MKRKIEKEIKRLALEIILVFVFLIACIPLWDYISNPTYAEIADHYSHLKKSEVVITNKRKYIYSKSYEEAIKEMNMAFITSYEEENKNYDIYILLEVGTNYDDIYFSNGSDIVPLKELYSQTYDYIYFKIDNMDIDSKSTIKYNYYIWNKNLKKEKNIKIKFAAM